MKCNAVVNTIIPTENLILVALEASQNALLEAEKLKGIDVSIEIEKRKEKRSTAANAYMWALLSKLAEKLETSKFELYLKYLKEYGKFTHVIVKPQAVEAVKKQWREVAKIGEVTVNGTTGIQLQCYFGSSQYNSKEMAVLIDAIVSDCKKQGIETISPIELKTMLNEWGE